MLSSVNPVQGRFRKPLEEDWLERADENRGSLGAFPVTLLRRFVAGKSQRENSKAWIEPAHYATPYQAFESVWVRPHS